MTSAASPTTASPTGAIVSADRLSRSFGDLVAVRDFSLDVRPGEIVGLLGPNGAGKTTAMRVLSTILPPSRGSFSICGIPGSRPDAIRGLIGVLPESAGYPRESTGDEFLRYHARLFGHTARGAREVAASLLEEVGLAERSRSRIATYSRGMRQRLGMARALVNTPRVIFLDEPTLGLDPAGQRQMLDLIRELAQERAATVILSTHLLDEVEESCSRVVILNRGEVIAEGTVAEIKQRAGAGTVRVRVPPESHDRARSALAQIPGTVREVPGGTSRGSLIVTSESPSPGVQPDAEANRALRALVAAGVPVLSFELEGGRLSDAFLALTGGERR